MKKIMLFICILLMIPANANAVENGQEVPNDPNAVILSAGWSGFLYSPRIVFTVAHARAQYEQWHSNNSYVGFPGQSSKSTGVKISKVFWASNYIERTSTNFARSNDFAIMVLEKPIAMKNEVRIATENEIKQYILNKTEISMVGYGVRNNDDRVAQYKNEYYPLKINSRLLDQNEINIIKNGLPPGWTYDTNHFQVDMHPGSASVCDGDSGSGWFVENKNQRIYIGTQSDGWGIPNCGKDGIWNPMGAMVGASPAYLHLNLLAEAEKYIDDHPYKDLTMTTTKKETNANKVFCTKGKTKKYFNAKKCPKGYTMIKK